MPIDLPTLDDPARLICGDALEVLGELAAGSVDAIVTDPPYGLAFMGKEWDSFGGQLERFGEFSAAWATAARRVIRPGGYMLAMGGTRTFHRLACALELAGWELRDTVAWLYGSGFPKGRACLKPAWEPILLARNPGRKVRPLGIDECRIGAESTRRTGRAEMGYGGGNLPAEYATGGEAGRWPANVAHDGSAEVLEAFDAFGELTSGHMRPTHTTAGEARRVYGKDAASGFVTMETYGDTGSAARFFYTAKASKAERDAGLEGLPVRARGMSNGAQAAEARGEDYAAAGIGMNRTVKVRNHHPTVKPLALMRWLVRLVTPRGGLVLDPFVGSGTTALAAVRDGRRVLGIDRDAAYLAIARARLDEPLGTGGLFDTGAPVVLDLFGEPCR